MKKIKDNYGSGRKQPWQFDNTDWFSPKLIPPINRI